MWDRSYQEFKQRVRRHRPSDVLTTAALASIQNERTRKSRTGPPLCPDFALAAVAKTSVCFGNEHREAGVTLQDLRAMCGALVAVRDPFLDDNQVGAFSVRMGFEQLPYQAQLFYDLARTKALLVDAAMDADQDLITSHYWKSILGCTIDEFVALALFLYAGALNNSGKFRSSWLSQPNFTAVYEHLPRDVIEQVSREHFIITRDRFREVAAAHVQADTRLRRFEFNPILLGPFVELPGRDPVAPVIYPILYRATPGSLYYTAVANSGDRFTGALSKAFEWYVGKQLALCEPEHLEAEIIYDKDNKKSVDHIMVMPRLVILVEVKATPLSEGARLGTQRLQPDLERAPGKGVSQIERTAGLIKDAHPSFAHIPRDRPIVGLVVTMEPYHLCANDLVFPNAHHAVPTWLCSARELEQFVVQREPSCEDLLLEAEIRPDRNSWSLSAKLPELQAERNPILDAIWEGYEFG